MYFKLFVCCEISSQTELNINIVTVTYGLTCDLKYDALSLMVIGCFDVIIFFFLLLYLLPSWRTSWNSTLFIKGRPLANLLIKILEKISNHVLYRCLFLPCKMFMLILCLYLIELLRMQANRWPACLVSHNASGCTLLSSLKAIIGF